MSKVLLPLLLIFSIAIGTIILAPSFVENKGITLQLPTPAPTLKPIPKSKTLPGGVQVFQTFNNCGPASLSMALSHYGVNVSQQVLGQQLRPYQNPAGDNDDKSVTLEELAEKSKEYGFVPFHRPNGNSDLVKKFISYDIPVIVRTTTKPTEDIGHYRVIKGFDETAGVFIQDDSLQGKDLRYSFDDFNQMWQIFNYEYLVLIPPELEKTAILILGQNADYNSSWQLAIQNSLQQLNSNPNDIYARFNLSVAYHNTGQYQAAVDEFEKVESQLSFRTLWYQIEPIESYYKLGNYSRVFEITDNILNNHNRAFSELYIIRGEIYKIQSQTDLADAEFAKAILYNQNLSLNSVN